MGLYCTVVGKTGNKVSDKLAASNFRLIFNSKMPTSGAPETLVLPTKQYGVTYQNTVIVTRSPA